MKSKCYANNRVRAKTKFKAREWQLSESSREIEERIYQLFDARRKLATELWRKSRYGKPLKKDYCEVEWI